ncbi:hypothetical protein IT408_02085 [Candidatus Uhrbacteria bacterium]|nr:hypothetical protein [Candidatus Uhrbacteria bacterium]
MARVGGEVIHLYDLGHALYPSNTKEWIQTRLCGTPLIRFIPEYKVARYLKIEWVQSLLEKQCDIEEVTWNNMPNLVRLVKSHMNEELMREIVHIEAEISKKVTDLRLKEQLFPSICFWTRKKDV